MPILPLNEIVKSLEANSPQIRGTKSKHICKIKNTETKKRTNPSKAIAELKRESRQPK
jgi:hypothetical protein